MASKSSGDNASNITKGRCHYCVAKDKGSALLATSSTPRIKMFVGKECSSCVGQQSCLSPTPLLQNWDFCWGVNQCQTQAFGRATMCEGFGNVSGKSTRGHGSTNIQRRGQAAAGDGLPARLDRFGLLQWFPRPGRTSFTACFGGFQPGCSKLRAASPNFDRLWLLSATLHLCACAFQQRFSDTDIMTCQLVTGRCFRDEVWEMEAPRPSLQIDGSRGNCGDFVTSHVEIQVKIVWIDFQQPTLSEDLGKTQIVSL